MMLCPEEANYDESEPGPTLLYDWDALQHWVSYFQRDSSIISKFRLQSLSNRIQGLTTDFRTKVICLITMVATAHSGQMIKRESLGQKMSI